MYSSVTHIVSQADIDSVIRHIERTVPQSVSPHWNPGRPGASELALLDAIFSSRAPYGRKETGVRRVVGAWSGYRGVAVPDDLTRLAEFVDEPEMLEEILGHRGRVPGNALTKAAAAAHAARVLTELGFTGAIQISDDDAACAAFRAVPGMGTVTWECFLVQLGVRTPAATRHLHRFVHCALAAAAGVDPADFDEVEAERADQLLARTAERLGVGLQLLEHAVWRFQHRGPRARRRVRTKHSNERAPDPRPSGLVA